MTADDLEQPIPCIDVYFARCPDVLVAAPFSCDCRKKILRRYK